MALVANMEYMANRTCHTNYATSNGPATQRGRVWWRSDWECVATVLPPTHVGHISDMD